MSYTGEQVAQYVVARELCNTRLANCSARIGEEHAKPVPDATVIDQVHAEMTAIVLERRALPLTDDAAVAASIRHSQSELARQRAVAEKRV